MKIVFGIMSAVHSAQAVRQLAGALAPNPVVIHHDFSQNPHFRVDLPNVSFVPQPKKTGWAVWGFSEGILHLVDHCLNHEQADYFQLLSPTCLPVRPLTEFAAHVARGNADVHIAMADMASDPDLLLNFGYRAFLPKGSMRFRMMRKFRGAFFGKDAYADPVANLQTLRRGTTPQSLIGSISRLATRLAQRGWMGSHCFQEQLRPLIGGTWFGCNREAGLYLLSKMRDERLRKFFARMWIADEMMFASVFGSSGLRIAASNHLISRFDEGNPRWFEMADLNDIFASGKYFARKFPDDASCPIRSNVLDKIISSKPGAAPDVAQGTHHFSPDLTPVGSSN